MKLAYSILVRQISCHSEKQTYMIIVVRFFRGKSKEGEGPENSEADPKKVAEVASAQGMATPYDPSTTAKKDNQMAQENPATPKIPSSSVVQEENRNA